jgi:hypothetical protein
VLPSHSFFLVLAGVNYISTKLTNIYLIIIDFKVNHRITTNLIS